MSHGRSLSSMGLGFAFSTAEQSLKAVRKLIQVPAELVSVKARNKRNGKFKEYVASLPTNKVDVWENQRYAFAF